MIPKVIPHKFDGTEIFAAKLNKNKAYSLHSDSVLTITNVVGHTLMSHWQGINGKRHNWSMDEAMVPVQRNLLFGVVIHPNAIRNERNLGYVYIRVKSQFLGGRALRPTFRVQIVLITIQFFQDRL